MGLGHHVFAITQKYIECENRRTVYYTTTDRLNNAILIWHNVLHDRKDKEESRKRKRVQGFIDMDEADAAKKVSGKVEEITELNCVEDEAQVIEFTARGTTDVDSTEAKEGGRPNVKRRKGRPPKIKTSAWRTATNKFRVIRPAPSERKIFPDSKAGLSGNQELTFSIQSAHGGPRSEGTPLTQQQPSEMKSPTALQTTDKFRLLPPFISRDLNSLDSPPGPITPTTTEARRGSRTSIGSQILARPFRVQ